ncbi:uncharacterized protein LOC115033024 isoform X1 [Acyrthosiphon pisum]|uniref:Peptidase S1 domain-containing protein n=3 Tax=Acyrthosiphon pisum TaxID=7029 RepID=A0A8R2JMJ5_ACYPI|nr:uncharacterized protein LOC115033024 isoform X1 [Acyrthosiphon pisum]
MKVTYSWIIYSCLIFGSSIMCDRKLEKRQAVSSCSVDDEDKFHCSNGLCIEWSWVCDDRKDCSDGSDETKELCARYEYGTNMTTNCGRVYVKNDEFIDNGEKSLVTLPWNVGIYQLNKTNSNYDLICLGSIISVNVVISAANCFWQEDMLSKQISINDSLYKFTVGKYDRNFTIINNDLTQIVKGEMVYLNKGFNGLDGLYADDIAVIVLANKVSFSNGVVPVCIDWKSKYNVKNGDQGRDVVQDMENGSSPVLLERFFKYFDIKTCRTINALDFNQYVTFDKFCTETKLGQMNLDDSGRGISFIHLNSYYLTGIISVIINLPTSTVIACTDVIYHIQWIRGILNKHFTVSSCVLPTAKGVVYSYEGSNEILYPGTLINHNLTVIENCEIGYYKTYTNGSRFCMGKGKWLTNFEKLCLKMCPPLESNSLDVICSHKGKYVNCSSPSIPDTIATPSCKPTYTAPNGQDETPLELLCQSNGTWNNQLYKCNPYCGRVFIKNQLLIENGENATVGTAPWNVGIYQLNKKKSNHDLICGGSIISPKLVVSAAHCFWQKGMLSRKISINDGLYKIAVGKYARNFTVIDNDFTQIINVETVHLNEGYYGPLGFHAEDIAIIVLQNRVSFSNGVAPVCIDWNGKYNVVNGDQGKIVGWGETEKGISSPILLEASLPYIDRGSCRNLYSNGFESFVTVGKFCAGSALVSGQGLGKGDSGAGLSFLHSNLYYLTGIVSIKDPNTENSIAVFTEIKYHIQWIRGLYNKHN